MDNQLTVLQKCSKILSSNEMFELRMALLTRRDFLRDQLYEASELTVKEWERYLRQFNRVFDEI